jgi:hypothetical protein
VRTAQVGWAVGFALGVAVPSLLQGRGNDVGTVGAYEVRNVPKHRVYIPCESASESEILALRRRLIDGGAEKVNLFFPSVIACEIPVDRSLDELIGDARFDPVEESRVDADPSPAIPEAVRTVRRCYETAERVSDDPPALAVEDGGFEDRVLVLPPEIVEESKRQYLRGSSGAFVETRNAQQNSEFMIGDILIRLVYPESRGVAENTEDWTDKELRDASQGAVSGALAFQEKISYVPLNFVFTTHNRVSVDYEPIKHTMDDDAPTWIMDAMTSLNYTGYKTADLAAHAFNNDGRRRFGTDWVYTAFIADSRNEPGHIFAGGVGGAGYTAYAFLGGPYLVIPYPAGANDPYGLGEVRLFSQIFQHESMHIFWALDEYPAAQSGCTSRTGYLNYTHANKLTMFEADTVGCPNFVNCLMWNARAAVSDRRPICKFTEGQIGTIDDNDNGIPDVFDAAPTLTFEGAPAETVTTPDITLRMKAIAVAVPNRNSAFQDGGIDYAAPLKDATLSVDGVGQTPLTPEDRRWDEAEEDLTFALEGLAAGLTQIQVKVRNVFGATSSPITKRIYFIGVKFGHFSVVVRRDRIQVDWETVGETFGARLDLYRIERGLGAPDTVRVLANAVPENPGELFQRFSHDDRDIAAGHEYAYFVVGEGEQPRFKTYSKPVMVKAMLPMDGGERVSQVAPNPFREATTISIDVPQTFVESGVGDASPARASGIRREVPTEVTIGVYDVQGRLVKKVYAGKMFSRVATFVWDGTNESQARVPSGIYFVKAQAGAIEEVRKVVVVR